MILKFYSIAISLLACLALVQSGDLIPNRVCASLFSSGDFTGDVFPLKDFDQSVNLEKDHRQSLSGWQATGSIRVEDDCKVTVCNDTYLTGECRSLSSSESIITTVFSDVQSVKCACKRECKCEDVIIRSTESDYGEWGRAYLKGGCNICDNQYISLRKTGFFRFSDSKLVDTFTLRSGCNLTLYPEWYFKGVETIITGPVYTGYHGSIGSYRFACDNTKYIAPVAAESSSDSPTIALPATANQLLDLLRENSTLANHPGVQAALVSSEAGRSHKNAYVILIGQYKPFKYGFPQCRDAPRNKIGECRIPVGSNDLGISNTHLVVITVPIDSRQIGDDLRWIASLDKFLSTYDDLKRNIPNAVIVVNDYSHGNGEDFEGASLQKLQVVLALQTRLLDENQSNLLFLLDNMDRMSPSTKRQPDEKIAQLERVIRNKGEFTNSINTVVKSYSRLYSVNGYVQMENREYWPKNLEDELVSMCKRSGDPLGLAILTAAFHEKTTPGYSVGFAGYYLVPPTNSTRVGQLREGDSTNLM